MEGTVGRIVKDIVIWVASSPMLEDKHAILIDFLMVGGWNL